MRAFTTAALISILAAWCAGADGPANVSPMSAQPPPTLVELPDAVQSRNQQLFAQRRQLSVELADGQKAAVANLKRVLPDAGALRNEQSRAALAPDAIKAIRTVAQHDIERFVFGGQVSVSQGKPGEAFTFIESSQYNASLLQALGDTDGAESLAKFARVQPELVKLGAELLVADAPRQQEMVRSLQKALESSPNDPVTLNGSIMVIRRNMTDDPALNDALFETFKATAGSSSTTAKVFVNRLEAQRRAKATAAGVGSDLVITGPLVDGSTFSTADWKGKVILVDFWATWCGPCKAELPHIKALYKKYHNQGLEVLGVSNDFTAKALTDYVAANPDLSWPQLFDAGAAAEKKWNPITAGFGIQGIPTMYLIDRQGVLRSVEARRNLDTLIPQLLAEPAN